VDSIIKPSTKKILDGGRKTIYEMVPPTKRAVIKGLSETGFFLRLVIDRLDTVEKIFQN